MVLAKLRYIQQDRIESPDINQHTYIQLVYNKRGKTIQWREDSLFSKLGKLGSYI